MLKTMINFLAGVLVASAVATAFAVTGIAPQSGNSNSLIDGTWLLGLAGGTNLTYQSGITAHAGGTQAACQVLPAGIALVSIDTVSSATDSVCMPFAVAGTDFQFAVNSSNSPNVYGQVANNPLTGAADTINGTAGSTAYQPAGQKNVECFSPKNGAWRCVTGS